MKAPTYLGFIPTDHRQQTRCRLGFTLMELLVVVIVIGILMALLMPTVSVVIDRAKRISCMSNLRGLTAGVLVYANEHHGEMPLTGDEVKMGWVGNWQNWWTSEFYPIQWYRGNGNMEINAATYLEEQGVINKRSVLCPAMNSYLEWEAGNLLGQYPTSYIYWGAPNHASGRGETMAQNAYPPPFWHKKLGAGARTSNIPPPVLIPGVGTRYTNVVGYAQTAIVRDEEVATPPIMSDLTWSTPWRQDFNHGKSLANCWVNTSYADGRVSGHKPDLVNPSMWLLGWGSSPITWYR